MFSILYLVHDLDDAAVRRRVMMLRAGGATVTLLGFRRSDTPITEVCGFPAHDLGRTHNGRFIQRIGAVIRQVLRIKNHRTLFEQHDIIIARNLEMLGIAARGRHVSERKAPLVYESLDIHRLLLRDDIIGRKLRQLEGWLCQSAALLITSSPAFIREYFEARSEVTLPDYLLENKVYLPDPSALPALTPRQPGPPWKIGWFGAIRCRQSLDILSKLVRQSNGRLEVIIRGKPALDQFDDFHGQIAATPGLRFEGPYRNPDDLEAMYHDVHFSWCIDRFEEGQNSAWLLPNRLYEGGLYGVVPIAQGSVETGHYLKKLGIGVPLGDDLESSLRGFLVGLDAEHYTALERAAMRIPRHHWLHDEAACIQLVTFLQTIAQPAEY